MTRMQRLKDAIEGECDGLAITDDRARAILEFLDAEGAQAKPAEARYDQMTEGERRAFFAEAEKLADDYLALNRKYADLLGVSPQPAKVPALTDEQIDGLVADSPLPISSYGENYWDVDGLMRKDDMRKLIRAALAQTERTGEATADDEVRKALDRAFIQGGEYIIAKLSPHSSLSKKGERNDS